MKRRILSLLLALCLVVGLLPMAVLAEDAEEPVELTSTLTVTTGPQDEYTQWKPEMAPGMDPEYAKTTAEGALDFEGVSESDWNLKAEWPIDGKPTLTLNGATLNNDTHHMQDSDPSVIHTIRIGGSADFEILLKGTNTINGNHAQMAAGYTSVANHRMATGIYATNKGTLTTKSLNKAVDTLTIDNNGGNGIYKEYNALTIDSANVTINMRNTASNGQNAIVMVTGGTAYADKTNLTIVSSTVRVWGTGRYLGNNFIVMGVDGANYKSGNTGDILFQNSIITMDRNNGTSANSSGAETIKYSPEGSMTIDRCDFFLEGGHRTFNYAPTVVNCTGVQSKTAWSDWAEYTVIPGTALTSNTNNSGLKGTHICLAGEPVVEKPQGDCATSEDTVAYCIVCDKELSRESTALTPSKVHTPGSVKQISKTNAKTGNVDGNYVMEHTCAICGQSWQETKTFGAATLYYLESGARSNSRISTSTSVTMKVVMNPGDATIYFTTGQYDETETYASNWYVRKEADFTEESAWNMKLEYPEYGTPVLTLRNAKIINNMGLWYGLGKNRTSAPVTIVLEGENYIETPAWTYHQSLGLHTTGGTTITGDGSLYIKSATGDSKGIVTSMSSVTLLNTNVHIQKNPTSNGASAIGLELTGGTLTVDNSTLLINGHYNATSNYRTFKHGIVAPNMTVKNGSNVTFTGSLQGWKDETYGINITNKLTIIESTVTSSHGGYAYGNAIKVGEFDLQFANGYNINFSTKKFTYTKDEETGVETYTLPAPTQTLNNIEDLIPLITTNSTANNYDYFVQFTPVAAVEKFEASAVTVTDDLTLEYAIKADKIPAGSIAYITRGETTTPITLSDDYKEGAYYIIPCTGIAAKEMHDQITVVIKDAEGNIVSETKTDSVYDYTVRMLAAKQGEMSDAKYAALKTVLVDMLNYGTMAQVQFEHNTENLANKGLSYGDWANATTEMQATPATPATATGIKHLGTTFELNTNIAMLVAVQGDVTSVKVYVDGVASDETATITAGEGYTIITFNGLNAADGRKEVKFEINNGEATVTDSLAAYVGRNIEKYPYLANLMKYCDAAATYFTTK